MPCDGSYMNPSRRERNISEVVTLFDELNGRGFNKEHFSGYHPSVYNKAEPVNLDRVVAALCKRLQKTDVTKYSLEMQMWWRDHQEADKERVLAEQDQLRLRDLQQRGLDKLSAEERKALGL